MRDLSLESGWQQGLQVITLGIREKLSPFERTALIRAMLLQMVPSVSHLKKEFIKKKKISYLTVK